MSICFIDSETMSRKDISAGAYAYATDPSTDVLVWGWVFDDEFNAEIWSPDWAYPKRTGDVDRLIEHAANGGLFVAWNAFFDRWVWNAVMPRLYGWPETRLDQWLCAQAQAEGSNLPGGLAKACETLGTSFKKDPQGKALIRQLCDNDRDSFCVEANEPAMARFRRYCKYDVLSMREAFNAMLPMTYEGWREYHASEHINDRGVLADVDFAIAARDYAEAEFKDLNAQLAKVTGDSSITLTTHARKAVWLHEALAPSEEIQSLTVRQPAKKGGPERLSCDRPTRDAVLDMLDQEGYAELFHVEQYEKVCRFLEILEAGNSAAVNKFSAIARQAGPDNRIRGCYSFNGAGQTGRFSSRGVQMHNMVNKAVDKSDPDKALDAMDGVLRGASPDELSATFGLPVSRLLGRLIRPTFIAREGCTLVWADYDQIEGRMLPWLSDTVGGDEKLDVYRSGRDVYVHTAAGILGIDPEDVTDATRQAFGKVPELALGFGGAVGALSQMCRAYGVAMSDEQKAETVRVWRNNNRWAVDFWHTLWDAALAAYANPGMWFPAGRVKYIFASTVMRGTLVCQLPCGRFIVYPQFRRDHVLVEDEDTGKKRPATITSFMKGFGSQASRVEIWYGTLAENITQGTAASALRKALVSLEDVAVLHTHDEIMIEVPEKDLDYWRAEIVKRMTDLGDWLDGAPITAGVEDGPYYTK